MIDITAAALHSALSGLAARQRVIANNVANVETPGFQAGRVDFESSLEAALRGGNPAEVSPSLSHSNAPSLPNGNNVLLDDEVVSLTDTGLRYQLMTEALNAKFRLLRTAIGSGR